jgi:hypothetical protein
MKIGKMIEIEAGSPAKPQLKFLISDKPERKNRIIA